MNNEIDNKRKKDMLFGIPIIITMVGFGFLLWWLSTRKAEATPPDIPIASSTVFIEPTPVFGGIVYRLPYIEGLHNFYTIAMPSNLITDYTIGDFLYQFPGWDTGTSISEIRMYDERTRKWLSTFYSKGNWVGDLPYTTVITPGSSVTVFIKEDVEIFVPTIIAA